MGRCRGFSRSKLAIGDALPDGRQAWFFFFFCCESPSARADLSRRELHFSSRVSSENGARLDSDMDGATAGDTAKGGLGVEVGTAPKKSAGAVRAIDAG